MFKVGDVIKTSVGNIYCVVLVEGELRLALLTNLKTNSFPVGDVLMQYKVATLQADVLFNLIDIVNNV